MHISNCLNPKKIRNPYTHVLQYVPCRECSACLNNHSFTMVERLNIECRLHKYVLFGTLTYDNAHVPTMYFNSDKSVALDSSFEHTDKRHGLYRVRIKDCDMQDKDYRFLDKIDSFRYLSHVDAQRFMKRLRINLYRLCKNNKRNEKESLLRFYLCGEYGPTNFRPHFHFLLFFDSDFTSANIQSLVAKSWQYGFIDTSFVTNTASSYVAKYVNCNSHLPAFLRHREIRPFCHYSRCPSIGCQFFNDQKIQEIFNTCSPTFTYVDSSKRQVVDVPLWRGIESRVFPRLPRFSELSHSARVTLYRTACDFPWFTATNFLHWAKSYQLAFDERHALLKLITDNCTLDSSLIRIWYMSKHVVYASSRLGVSIDTYVQHIEQYYINKDYEKLKKQYEFQEDFSKEHDIRFLSYFDRLWLEKVSDLEPWKSDFNVGSDEFSKICLELESYNIDPKLFYHADLTTREKYRSLFSLELCSDFIEYRDNNDKIIKDTTKTKKKNDYLRYEGQQTLSDLYE